jgi:hypothetical protein
MSPLTVTITRDLQIPFFIFSTPHLLLLLLLFFTSKNTPHHTPHTTHNTPHTRAEYGLAYDVHTKKLDDAAKTGGLHSGPPGGAVQV